MDVEQRKAEQRAKVEDLQGSGARKRAVWRLSPLVPRDLGWLFEYARPVGYVLIFILMSGILYIRYFLNGEHPVEGGGRMGGSFTFDPAHEDGWGLLYVFIATVVLAIAVVIWAGLARRAGRRAYADERAYSQELPYSLFGYPAVVGEHECEYSIDIFFVDQEPDREKLTGLVTDIDGFITDTDPAGRGQPGRHFIAKYPKAEDSGNNAQRFVGTVRALTGALVAMHASSPIDRVELTGWTTERFKAGMSWTRRD
jgi:hypothetical protein